MKGVGLQKVGKPRKGETDPKQNCQKTQGPKGVKYEADKKR